MPVVSIIKRDMPITMAPGILEIKIVFLARLFFVNFALPFLLLPK